jgi:hypothetical protein
MPALLAVGARLYAAYQTALSPDTRPCDFAIWVRRSAGVGAEISKCPDVRFAAEGRDQLDMLRRSVAWKDDPAYDKAIAG